MDDPEDKTPAAAEHDMSDDEAARAALDNDDVPQLEPQDAQDGAAPQELTDIPVRSRPRMEAFEEGSEMGSLDGGSVDALPRRVDSPIDSVLSGPDETPSVQVRST